MWLPQIETAIKFTIKRKSKRSQHFLHLQQHQQHLLQHPSQQQLRHWKHLLRHIKNPQTRPRQHIGHLQQQQQETQQQSASTLLPLLRAKTYLCMLKMGSSTLGWWSRWSRSKGSAWSGLGTAQSGGQVSTSCNASERSLRTNVAHHLHRHLLNLLVQRRRRQKQVINNPDRLSRKILWEFTLRKSLQMKSLTVVLNVQHLSLWRDMSVLTLVKNGTSALNAITLSLQQIIWKYIWEHTLEINRLVVLSVVLCVTSLSLDHIIWQYTWEYTLEKSLQRKSVTGVPNVTTLAQGQNIWKCTWEFTLARSLTAALSAITLLPNQQIWRDMWWEIILKRRLTAVLNEIIWRYMRFHTVEKPHCDHSRAYSNKKIYQNSPPHRGGW